MTPISAMFFFVFMCFLSSLSMILLALVMSFASVIFFRDCSLSMPELIGKSTLFGLNEFSSGTSAQANQASYLR